MSEPRPTPEQLPPEVEKPRKPWTSALIVVLALGVLAIPVVWFLRNSQQPEIPLPARTPEAPKVETPPPEVSIPKYEADAHSLLSSLSPKLAELFSEDGLLRKIVAAVQLSSEGESCLHLFPNLRPSQAFATETRGGKTVIAESSYHRYDALVSTITSVDGDKVAAAYSQLKPAFEQLYREVGRPGVSFDQALAKALAPVIDAKPDAEPVEVVPKGLVFAFKDPAKEAMDPTSKLLVRVGPDNAKKLQELTKKFAAAASLPSH